MAVSLGISQIGVLSMKTSRTVFKTKDLHTGDVSKLENHPYLQIGESPYLNTLPGSQCVYAEKDVIGLSSVFYATALFAYFTALTQKSNAFGGAAFMRSLRGYNIIENGNISNTSVKNRDLFALKRLYGIEADAPLTFWTQKVKGKSFILDLKYDRTTNYFVLIMHCTRSYTAPKTCDLFNVKTKFAAKERRYLIIHANHILNPAYASIERSAAIAFFRAQREKRVIVGNSTGSIENPSSAFLVSEGRVSDWFYLTSAHPELIMFGNSGEGVDKDTVATDLIINNTEASSYERRFADIVFDRPEDSSIARLRCESQMPVELMFDAGESYINYFRG
jgi:hypothetical protein